MVSTPGRKLIRWWRSTSDNPKCSASNSPYQRQGGMRIVGVANKQCIFNSEWLKAPSSKTDMRSEQLLTQGQSGAATERISSFSFPFHTMNTVKTWRTPGNYPNHSWSHASSHMKRHSDLELSLPSAMLLSSTDWASALLVAMVSHWRAYSEAVHRCGLILIGFKVLTMQLIIRKEMLKSSSEDSILAPHEVS